MRFRAAVGSLVLLAALGAAAQEAQPKLEPPRPMINIRMERATIGEVLLQLGDLSGISIVYAEGLDETLATGLVNITFRNTAVEDVLKFLLVGPKLTFVVLDPRTIRIEPLSTP